MKKIFTLLLLALVVQVSFAQEEEEAKKKRMESDINTIFDEDNLKFTGGFIGPELKVSNIYDDEGLLIGGRMGATFNDKFTMGLGGYGLVTKSSFDYIPTSGPVQPIRIGMGYGGLALEYTIFGKKKIHFSVPVLVGVGGFTFYEDDEDLWDDNFNDIETSAAFVAEPGVNLELNLFKYFRFSAGVSYRYVAGTSFDDPMLEGIDDGDLSDLSYNATLKFGFF